MTFVESPQDKLMISEKYFVWFDNINKNGKERSSSFLLQEKKANEIFSIVINRKMMTSFENLF